MGSSETHAQRTCRLAGLLLGCSLALCSVAGCDTQRPDTAFAEAISNGAATAFGNLVEVAVLVLFL